MIVNLPSRSQLISWANSITNANINNLQQLSDGIQFCQIFDKMYPNVINISKIKRDDSRTLTKQHNFRQLLNAINIKQLPLKIQIIDLSSGKLTSILQLLQWFYKEYNKNFSHHGNNQRFNQGGFKEATIFKSYVGAVVPRQKNQLPRQKSQFKVQSKRRSPDKDPNQRKSLDIKRLSSSAISRVSQKGQEQYNSQKELQNQKDRGNLKHPFSYKVQSIINQNSKKKDGREENLRSQRKSMIVNISTTQQHFQKMCQQKQSQRKTIRQNKKNVYNQKCLKETLEEIFNFNKNGMRNSLIRVTQVVLGQNPQLESKINKVLIHQVQNDQNYVHSPKKNMFSQSGNTSLICEHDSSKKMQSMIKSQIHSFQLDKSKLNFQIFKNPSQLNQKNSQQQQNYSKDKQSDQIINNENNQKDTVKKSSVKQIKLKPNHPIVMQKAIISKISAQKQKIYQKKDLLAQSNGSKNLKDLVQIKNNPSQLIIQPCNSILYNPFQNSLNINIQSHNQENLMNDKLDANKKLNQNVSKKENANNSLNAQNYAYQQQKNAKINPQIALYTDGKKSKQSNFDRKLAQSQKFGKKQDDDVVDTTVWNVFTNFTQDPNWRN